MSSPIATGLAITNPLVKYRALLATKAISPDNGQLRLALHLRKVYDRLKDYEPEVEYSRRLDQISRAVTPNNGALASNDNGNVEAETPQPQASRRGAWRSFFGRTEKTDSLALTRRLTSHESALQLNTPKGLMLHGEVGTGKSMLIDLFADCLPNRKKRRWHFNTFMLETFAKLESYRQSRTLAAAAAVGPTAFSTGDEDDYSLLWLAKDLVQTSPIVFLDEFQMPDRAASKILTNLMTSFFHLGGVLVATSNRMPEELAKAAGIDLAPPPSRLESLGWQFGFRRKPGGNSGRNEFAKFLEVLKARCEVWEMEGVRDWRRVESSRASSPVRLVEDDEIAWQLDGQDDLVAMSEKMAEEEPPQDAEMPKYYHTGSLNEPEHRKAYESALQQATGQNDISSINFTPSTMRVYGRTIPIPLTHTTTVTQWTFTELCKSTLGPADYITLASTYQTLILLDVPILTTLMKNEARRFITLLDALYECRCKLFITAEAGPDELFFPETKGKVDEDSDAIQSETFAEAYQDATAPFRPNILTDNPNYAEPDPEPDYTHARLAGLLNARLNADALEDDPPNQSRSTGSNPFGRSFGRTDAEIMKRERAPIDPDEPRFVGRGAPDFGKTSAFTGEDERFAYKRARSRLWELCGARWWSRNETDWHRPLPAEVRRWEVSAAERAAAAAVNLEDPKNVGATSDVKIGGAIEDETRDERSFKSPFKDEREPAPKLSSAHIWSLGQWGPRAGAWGEGVDGLKERGKESK